MKKRNALYLGEKDQDIVEFISPLLKHYDFSSIVRELIRDGIKFRQGVGATYAPPPTPSPFLAPSQNVLQSSHQSEPMNFKDIVLKEKELDLDDISDKLDLL